MSKAESTAATHSITRPATRSSQSCCSACLATPWRTRFAQCLRLATAGSWARL